MLEEGLQRINIEKDRPMAWEKAETMTDNHVRTMNTQLRSLYK